VNNPNAISDGDEKGKGDNNGKVGSLTDINTRIELINKNVYKGDNGYSSIHPNALSDGDIKGKGEVNTQVGSSVDINNRIDSIARNKYGETKRYPDF
jgi:hypothetical protein